MAVTNLGRFPSSVFLVLVVYRKVMTSLPGGNSEWEPPDSISNSEVKLLSADDSVGIPYAKVGHRQALIPKTRWFHQRDFLLPPGSYPKPPTPKGGGGFPFLGPNKRHLYRLFIGFLIVLATKRRWR